MSGSVNHMEGFAPTELQQEYYYGNFSDFNGNYNPMNGNVDENNINHNGDSNLFYDEFQGGSQQVGESSFTPDEMLHQNGFDDSAVAYPHSVRCDFISSDQTSQSLGESTYSTSQNCSTSGNSLTSQRQPFSEPSSLSNSQINPSSLRGQIQEEGSSESDEGDEVYNTLNNQIGRQCENGSTTQADKQQRVKRQISKKKYEPIYDCNQLFVYEDNPVEYKKARKQCKLWNRQSARKVRSVNKSVAESLEQNVEKIQQDNRALREQVADLSAQNARLKDEVSYFRSLFRETRLPMEPIINQNTNNHKTQQYPLNYVEQTGSHLPPPQNCGTLPYTSVRSVDPRRHSNSQLFVLVVVSCVMVMSFSSVSSDIQLHQNVIMEFQRDIDTLQQKDVKHNTELDEETTTTLINITELSQQIGKNTKILLRHSKFFEYIKATSCVLVLCLYLSYLIYIIYSNFFRKKSNDKQKHL